MANEEWEEITPQEDEAEWEDVEWEDVSPAPVTAPAPVAAGPSSPTPSNRFMQAWEAVNAPLITAPAEIGTGIAERMTEPSLETSPMMARVKGFFGGAAEGAGNVISGMTSPLSLATMGAGGAALRGVKGAALATKALSAPVAAHGAYNIATGETPGEQAFGVAELAGGLAGMKTPIPTRKPGITKITPSTGTKVPEAVPTDFPTIAPEFFERMPAQDPNLHGGVGDPMLAGSTPYAAAPEPPKPTKFVVKKPTPALIERLKQEGYVPTKERSPEGFAIMERKPQGETQKTTSKEVPPKLLEPTPARMMPFDREVTLEKPNAVVVKKMTEQGFTITDITEDGNATFRFNEKPPELPKPVSNVREAYNLARGLMSVDPPFVTSAAFRQGYPLAWTKAWWKSWGPAARAYGSKNLYNKSQEAILEHNYFKNRIDAATGKMHESFAKESGLDLTDLKDLSSREEGIVSTWAEKYLGPYSKHVRGSNRAYTAFLNKVRSDTFIQMVDDAKARADLGDGDLNPFTNPTVAKEIAGFINDATGRGSLTVKVPLTGRGTFGGKQIKQLERAAPFFRDVFFSPKLMASRVRLMQPWNYVTANPVVRKQYLNSMMRMAGTWMTMAGLAKMAGADVVLDPTNSDFGKIKIGNTRLDPAAGFQQYLVLMSRLGAGGTTPSTNPDEFHPFGEGPLSGTPGSTVQDFVSYKLHPVGKMVYDAFFAKEYKPFHLFDRTAQLFVPMITSDLLEVAKENPELIPLIPPLGAFVGVGGGMQTYGEGPQEPMIVPEEMDVVLGK